MEIVSFIAFIGFVCMVSSSPLWRRLQPFSHINLFSVRHWKQSMSIECNHLIWFDSRIMSCLGSLRGSSTRRKFNVQCWMSPPSFGMEVTHRHRPRHTWIWMRSRSSNEKALLCLGQFKQWRNTSTPISATSSHRTHYPSPITCNEKRLFISNLFFIFAEAHMCDGVSITKLNAAIASINHRPFEWRWCIVMVKAF